MMYDLKALYEAESVEHAVALLMEHPEAQIIAGGSDVLVQMREGKRAGKELVSIYGIDAMRGVSFEEDGAIRIGSLTSFSHITKDPIIQKYINVLGEAVDMVGGPHSQVNAGIETLAVDQDVAGSALSYLTALLDAGKAEIIPQHIG